MPSKELCEKCYNKSCVCKDCKKIKKSCEKEYPGASTGCGFRECCDESDCFEEMTKEKKV